MERTIKCKMAPSPLAAETLGRTLDAFASACNFVLTVSKREHTSNKVSLQHLAYRDIRTKFGLSANLAVRAIARVAWATKAAKRKGRTVNAFHPTSADYDERIFSYQEHEESVSLTTVSGRIHVPLALGTYQRDSLQGKHPTAAKVVRIGQKWFIHIVISEEPGTKPPPICTIGVDRGIYNLAVTSPGTFHSGRKVRNIRDRFSSRRARLQAKGTRSAKRVLQRLSGREHRWMCDVNHCISKSIVKEAESNRAIIVMEDLKGIRNRTRCWSRSKNRMVNAWAFRELENFVRYKAERDGVDVVSVPAANTSRTCPQCGTVDKESRGGAHFKCVFCGHRLAADLAAARAIAERHACPARAPVNEPMVSEKHLAPSGTSPAL